MNLDIKIARTPQELDGLFRLRYRIFGEELNYIETRQFPDGREQDCFDSLPMTVNFIAKKGDETVGTVRLIEDTGLPYNIENYINVDRLKREKDIRLAEASRFCVVKDERLNPNITHGLCKIVINYAYCQGITDIIILSNSTKSKEGNTIKYFQEIGFYQFAEEIYYEKFNEHAIPLRLNLKEISGIMMSFLKKRTAFIEKPYDRLDLDSLSVGV